MRRGRRIDWLGALLVSAGCSSHRPPAALTQPEIYDFTSEGSFPAVRDVTAMAAETPGDSLTVQSGWSVQVFAGRSSEIANNLHREVQSLVSEPVYVDYIDPYYKVRVGDCVERSECDALQRQLLELGIESAWVVPSRFPRIHQP